MFIHEENRDKKVEQLFCQFSVPFLLPFTNCPRPIKILNSNKSINLIQEHSGPFKTMHDQNSDIMPF